MMFNLTPIFKESFSTSLTGGSSAFWVLRVFRRWWLKKTLRLINFLSSMSSFKIWLRNKSNRKPLFIVSWTNTFWTSCLTVQSIWKSYQDLWCLSSLKTSRIYLLAWRICGSTKTLRSFLVEKKWESGLQEFKLRHSWRQDNVITQESTLYLGNSTPDASNSQV